MVLCTVENKLLIIDMEKLSLEVREVSKNVTNTLPHTANPHIRIYREIGQKILTSTEETQTVVLYIYRYSLFLKNVSFVAILLAIFFIFIIYIHTVCIFAVC